MSASYWDDEYSTVTPEEEKIFRAIPAQAFTDAALKCLYFSMDSEHNLFEIAYELRDDICDEWGLYGGIRNDVFSSILHAYEQLHKEQDLKGN